MTRSLAPALLLSMPQLLDPNFCRTVVLLCRHNDEGAFGLIVNRPLVTTDCDFEVWLGGPVEPERSWILVGSEELDDLPAMRVGEGLSLSTSPDSATARYGVLTAAQTLAQHLNGMTSDIQGMRSDAELALFQDVLGAEVVRETHIACGDRSCTYRITET